MNRFKIAVIGASFLTLPGCATRFDLQAHRGGRGLAPENTLTAFSKAFDIGVSTLELEIGRAHV